MEKNQNLINRQPKTIPTIQIFNRQKKHSIDLTELYKLCRSAIPYIIDKAPSPRLDLKEIEVSLVSDRRIARVHRDFMDTSGATDVITFAYGELVVSVDTAKRVASEISCALETELALYTIHGILHLFGWDDLTPKEAQVMHKYQQQVLNIALSSL